MNKTEILDLLNKQYITTSRAEIRPMTKKDMNDFSSQTSRSFSASDTKITFSVRLKENGTYIGYFELKNLDTIPEIGIELIQDYQKQGLGFEVCRAVVDYIFSKTDIKVLQYNCFRNNCASLQLAKKLGAVKVREKVLLDKLQKEGLPPEIISESAGFDLIVHEIRK